jgi:hypothetical protein
MIPDSHTGRLIAALLENHDEPDAELDAPDGRRYTKRSAPEPGVRTALDVTEPGQAPQRAITIFEAQASRPYGYPAALPFVPDTVAYIHHASTLPPSLIVIWRELIDDDALERRLVELSEMEGWRITREPKQLFGDLASPRELRRGTERRLVSRLPREDDRGGGLMLIQS